MNLISEIHGKSSERTVSNAVAGYVVPITALGLSSLFDTMKKKKAKKNEPIVDLEGEIWEPVVGYEGLYEVSNKEQEYNNWLKKSVAVMQNTYEKIEGIVEAGELYLLGDVINLLDNITIKVRKGGVR